MKNKSVSIIAEPDTNVSTTHSSPELKSDSPTLIPTVKSTQTKFKLKKKGKLKHKNVKAKMLPEALARTASAKPLLEMDPSPTTRGFEMMQQELRIIKYFETKAKFIECVVNYDITNKIDAEALSDVVAHILHGNAMNSDIISSIKLASPIASIIQAMSNINYRKLSNANDQ